MWLPTGRRSLVVGRRALNIDVVGGSALPQRVKPVAGALQFQRGAAVRRFGRQQGGGRLGFAALKLGLARFQRGLLSFGRTDLRAQGVDLSQQVGMRAVQGCQLGVEGGALGREIIEAALAGGALLGQAREVLRARLQQGALGARFAFGSGGGSAQGTRARLIAALGISAALVVGAQLLQVRMRLGGARLQRSLFLRQRGLLLADVGQGARVLGMAARLQVEVGFGLGGGAAGALDHAALHVEILPGALACAFGLAQGTLGLCSLRFQRGAHLGRALGGGARLRHLLGQFAQLALAAQRAGFFHLCAAGHRAAAAHLFARQCHQRPPARELAQRLTRGGQIFDHQGAAKQVLHDRAVVLVEVDQLGGDAQHAGNIH